MNRFRVWTESDEYISLRQEASILFTQSRQILYITTAFVIVALGWYATLTTSPTIPLWIFTLFLYGVLYVSGIAYVVNTNQAYRIGGYLAVFWESHDPDIHLAWHRLNRLGPPGGFLPNAATVIYTADTLAILSFYLTGIFARLARPTDPLGLAVIAGIIQVLVGLWLGAYLRRRRDSYELAWREIRESPDRLQAIHSRYEAVPSRIILQ